MTAVEITWPTRFSENFKPSEILKIDFLLGSPNAEGQYACKVHGGLCSGSREAHFNVLAHEFEAWQRDRDEAIKMARVANLHKADPNVPKSEFYANPCRDCGAGIPRTGKRGKPPVKCSKCRAVKVEAPKVKGSTVKCVGHKADGQKCGNKRVNGSKYCRWHQDQA